MTERVRKVEVQPRSAAVKGLFHVVSSISESWSGVGSKAYGDYVLSSTCRQVGEDPGGL